MDPVNAPTLHWNARSVDPQGRHVLLPGGNCWRCGSYFRSVPYPPKCHKHLRLPGNDYTTGAYFVTLCTRLRREWFGRIVGSGVNAIMEPNELGRIVVADWNALPRYFPHVRLDQFQLMPDHMHGILSAG